jgi:hypothetical protein
MSSNDKPSRDKKRAEKTTQLMQNIMAPGAGEISKKREAELAKAADAGRGVQFKEGSPKVGNLTQKGGKPVFRTGATAADYTGRIVANAPTFREAVGDAGRALFGGKADDTQIRKDTKLSKNILPEPRETKGFVPTLIEKGGIVGSVVSSIATGKEKKKKKLTSDEIYNQGVTDFAALNRSQLGGKSFKLGD